MVDHTILLNKIKDIGISGSALSLFTFHQNKRKQIIKINDTIIDKLTEYH